MGTDTDQSIIHNFLLVLYSNYGTISYWYKTIIAKLSHPTYLIPPLRGFPLEFCNGDGPRKTRMVPLPDRQKLWLHVHSFRHNIGIWQTDRQTDGQIFRNNIVLCMHCTLMCDKNWIGILPAECQVQFSCLPHWFVSAAQPVVRLNEMQSMQRMHRVRHQTDTTKNGISCSPSKLCPTVTWDPPDWSLMSRGQTGCGSGQMDSGSARRYQHMSEPSEVARYLPSIPTSVAAQKLNTYDRVIQRYWAFKHLTHSCSFIIYYITCHTRFLVLLLRLKWPLIDLNFISSSQTIRIITQMQHKSRNRCSMKNTHVHKAQKLQT